MYLCSKFCCEHEEKIEFTSQKCGLREGVCLSLQDKLSDAKLLSRGGTKINFMDGEVTDFFETV